MHKYVGENRRYECKVSWQPYKKELHKYELWWISKKS
jgi:hypothetical protein